VDHWVPVDVERKLEKVADGYADYAADSDDLLLLLSCFETLHY